MNDYPYRNEPAWTARTLQGLQVSVFCSGCDKARADEPLVVSYNHNVSYETLRVAVIDAVSKVLDVPNAEPAAVGPVDDYPGSSASPSPTFDVPESFRKFTLQGFQKYLTIYKTCEEQQKVLGQSKGGRSNMHNYFDPEGQGITSNAGRGKYDFIALATKIQALKPLVDAKLASKKNPNDYCGSILDFALG